MKNEMISENGKEWLKKETRPYRTFILFLTFLTAFATALHLAFAYLVKFLINSASDNHKRELILFSAILLGVLLLRILLRTITGFCSEKLRARMIAEMRTKLFSKILRSDYASLQEYHSGDLLTRLTSDIQEIAVDTVGFLPAVIGMVVQATGAIGALLTIDPLFTAIYVVCGGVFGAITALFRKQIKKRHKDVMEADAKSRAYMQEGLTSVLTVKAYGVETKSTQKAQTFANAYYEKRMKQNVLRAWMSCVFSLLNNFGLIFAVIWCSVSILNGNDDYGSILSVILLLMQLQQPLSSFSSIVPVYYARLSSGERLATLENLPAEITGEETVEVDALYGKLQSIDFENVSFTYGRDQVFTSANAKIRKGDIVCLTGASGSGKSTIFKLLLNVYSAQSGKVTLKGNFQGEDTLHLTAKERGLFAYVPQGNFLFSGTIYENLTFFTKETDKDALSEQIKGALDVACAGFVWELPDGLQTPLTEGGGGLSEGQLQRLAVARAILSDRPILLLDEATSALDGETEKQLLENVRSLQGKTCLIVTHRPAALFIADCILQVENGEISLQK
ncbi:MAG: ABC transporter ATP-binding protein [Clostridia bacterium]|nr:ABC transporter ATP-binding protein [Clostridia bacterium]